MSGKWPEDPVERHHDEDYDRAVDEHIAADSAALARTRFPQRDYAGVAAAMGMHDLAVRIAEDALDDPVRRRRAEARQRQRVEKALRTAIRYLDGDEPFRARLELEYLAEQDVADARVHFFYGVALYRRDEHAAATASFRRAQRHGGPVADCGRYLALCFLGGNRPEEAVGALDEAIAAAPGRADLRILRAESRLRLKGSREDMERAAAAAVDDLRSALALGARGPRLHLSLGRALWRSRRPEESLAALAVAEGEGIRTPELLYLRALACMDSDRLQEAEAALDEALRLAEDDVAVVALRAEVRRLRGRYAEAVEDATRLIELEPRRIRGLIERGRTLLASGQAEEALADFSAAEQMARRSPQPPFHRARCLLALGRTAEAEQAASRALELGPGFGPAIELLAACRSPG